MRGRAGRAVRGVAGLVAALAVAGMVAGCGPDGDPRPATSSSSSSPGGFGAARLAAALPDSYDGFGAATRPATGTYASLPTSAAAGGVSGAPAGVTFTPANCERVIWNGPDAARFGRDPAAVVVLRKPGDTGSATRLWAELIAVPAGPAKAALGTGPASGCDSVRGRYRGRELAFDEEKAPGGLGSAARGARVRSGGSPETRVIAFLGRGYVGVVYGQGEVSRTDLGAFALRVYRTAHARLA